MRWSDFLLFNVRIALAAIVAHRLRSALTLLGMMIGVLCVTLVLSFSESIKKGVGDALESFGGNMAILTYAEDPRGRKIWLNLRDIDAIRNYFPGSTVAPVVSSSQYISYDGDYENTDIWGVTPSYFSIRNMTLVEGRMLSAAELHSSENLVLLTKGLAERLLGADVRAAGAFVEINHVPYLVAGVVTSAADTMSVTPQYRAYMPYLTVRQRYVGDNFTSPDIVYYAFIHFGPHLTLTQGQQALEAFLRKRFYVDAHEDMPFQVQTTQEMVDKMMSTIKMVQIGLMGIASVSLLVGGIGIMNIMLVSVAERTREIGIRMAVGAPPHVIRVQFLMEAAVLCALGGVAGMLLADGVLRLVTRLSPLDVYLSLPIALLVFGFSIFVGLVAGYVPAARASRLDPVAALRAP